MEFQRSIVELQGQPLPVLSAGQNSWIFVRGKPLQVPSYLTIPTPRFLSYATRPLLSYLLQDAFQPPKSDTLEATIIPNMACNLACRYCFQREQVTPDSTSTIRVGNYSMAESVMDATAKFVEQQRLRQDREKVCVILFGGEPLLNVGRCTAMLDRIKKLDRAGMVTNGVRLTVEAAKELANHGLVAIHISFDGAKADHDNLRVRAVDDGPTYDTIIGNLERIDSLDLFPSRTIRVNVTQSNIARLDGLVDDLAGRLNPANWVFYMSLIQDNSTGFTDVVHSNSVSAFNRMAAVARKAAQAGFRMPAPNQWSSGGCKYCTKPFGGEGIIIDADGQLYSSMTSAGHRELAVGTVWEGYKPKGNEAKWVGCHASSKNPGSRDIRLNSELNWFLREQIVRRSWEPLKQKELQTPPI